MAPRETLEIAGECGPLEALLSVPDGMQDGLPGEVPRGLCLVCHPHPLHGGAMSNKVVHILASAALDAGRVALRFNFRGVGASAGEHDGGPGEIRDAVAAATWLRARYPQQPLALAGFSFGAHVVLRAARQLEADVLVTVGTPPGHYFGDESPPLPECPWLAIHGSDDEVVDCPATLEWLRACEPPPRIEVVDGAGHFFHGRLGDIKALAAPFLQLEG